MGGENGDSVCVNSVWRWVVVGTGEVWEVRMVIVYVLTVCEGGGHRWSESSYDLGALLAIAMLNYELWLSHAVLGQCNWYSYIYATVGHAM